MMQQRPVFQPFSKQKIQQIFLGIDFGTSYTKLSYSYAPSSTPQIHTLKWNDDFFKKSILYFQNGRLFFDKPIGDCDEIKYFKYSILEPKLQNNHQDTKCNFEELCCVYFLAQLIKRSLIEILELLKISNDSEVEISVNMGVPLENFYNEKNKPNKDLYYEILENAVTLAGGSKIEARLPENQVLLSNLDEVYSEILCKKAELNWKVNVFPELAAELLLYHQSKFVPEGVYSVVDIGGGTVDMALFQKYISNGNTNLYCLSQRVLPFGIEVISNIKNSQTLQVFQQEFAKMLMNSKEFADVNYVSLKKIDVFFLGGGANDKWYTNGIYDTKERLKKGGIPELSFSHSLMDFIESEENLIHKNQRLIISQMLARHANDITNVNGYPDWYETELKQRIVYEETSLEDIMYERAKNSGLNTVG